MKRAPFRLSSPASTRQSPRTIDNIPHRLASVPCEYYWAAAQAEYSTDVMFKNAEGLREL
jgi:hypothetical protein